MIYFTIHILHFMNDSNSRKNNLQGFENSQMDMRRNSQMDMRGCVWVWPRFLKAMTSDR